MACAVLLAVVAYVAVRGLTGEDGAVCTVRATGSPSGASHGYELKPLQAANAATIAAVASRRGLPERAVTIALATAMQESHLRNIAHGDRDSLGLFQQRPSQGWGDARQIQDPVYASDRFYDHLVEVPGYSRLPLTVAAQRVQRSGYPQAYAKHEADATLLTAALTGREAAALTCTAGTLDPDEPGDPERVRERLAREFGRDVLTDGTGAVDTSARGDASAGRGADDGTARRSPAHPDAAHPDAAYPAVRNGSAPVVSVPARQRRQGWELAHWAVANAAALHIRQISYDGRRWSAARSAEGWRATGAKDTKDAKGDGSGSRRGGGAVQLLLAGH
ncbi:heavy metal transporter [Streptomyces albus subsp. chlorinus]|nr:heavy metal transporter [Streptomyces albus subsp. chlorinus]